jgi:hypothetical protein
MPDLKGECVDNLFPTDECVKRMGVFGLMYKYC